MATWRSKSKFYFDSAHETPLGSEKSHFVWEYNTTSDYLTIRKTEVEGSDAYLNGHLPERVTELALEPGEAFALLEALKSWVEDMG